MLSHLVMTTCLRQQRQICRKIWGNFPNSQNIGDKAKNPIMEYKNYTIPQTVRNKLMSDHSSALETFVIIALYKSTFTIPYYTIRQFWNLRADKDKNKKK